MEGLTRKLRDLKKSDIYPFHMPGHKRNTDILGSTLPYGLDITEITGFDNLHSASGVIEDIQKTLREFYKAQESFLLVNGSTCGILASILSACDFGDKVIVARNCHKSVYNAIELYNLKPVWVMPQYDESVGIYCEVSPYDIERALSENTDARLVILTSPTYEGIISDIPAIADICHRFDALLLTDMAHGAHLPLFAGFEEAYGADISVVSLHKTLPCMTQTACLNIYSEKIDSGKVKKLLSSFETSSPSYPLMASVDSCFRLLKERGNELSKVYEALLGDFYDKLFRLKALRIYRTDDYGKLVIACDKANISGGELFSILRDKFNLECEMASARYVIAMSSICDTKKGFERLAKALLEIDGMLTREQKSVAVPSPEPKVIMTSYEATRKYSELIPYENACGKISSSYIWTYPPGVPLIAPGELIESGHLKLIEEYKSSKIEVHFENGDGKIGVIASSPLDK